MNEDENIPEKWATYSFIIEGQHYGEVCRPYIHVPVHGEAYWCQQCAKIWATVYSPDAITSIFEHPCEKHINSFGDFWGHPGSLFELYQSEDKILLPRKALEREFLLLCKRKHIGD